MAALVSTPSPTPSSIWTLLTQWDPSNNLSSPPPQDSVSRLPPSVTLIFCPNPSLVSGYLHSPTPSSPTDVRRISRKLPADSHPPPPLAAMPPPLLMTCHHHTTTMPPPLHHHTTTTTPPPPPPPLMTYFNPAQIQSNAAPCCDLLIFARPVAEYLRNWPPAGCKQNYKYK